MLILSYCSSQEFRLRPYLILSSVLQEIAQEHLAAEVSNLPHDRLRRDVSDDAKPIGEVVYLNDTNGILVKVHSSFYLYMSGLVLSTANKTTNFFNLTKTPNGTVNDFTNTTSGGK